MKNTMKKLYLQIKNLLQMQMDIVDLGILNLKKIIRIMDSNIKIKKVKNNHLKSKIKILLVKLIVQILIVFNLIQTIIKLSRLVAK